MDSSTVARDFLASNMPWIRPLIGAFLLVFMPPALKLMFGQGVPEWMVTVGLVTAFLAVIMAGIRARMADTLTAQIAMWFITAAGLFFAGAGIAELVYVFL